MSSWQTEAILRLVVAAALGAAIGLERERHGRSAGLRTHLLVALGAAMAMVVSLNFEQVFGARGQDSSLRVDPARLAYGVMAGIGFLGAGTIIQYGAGVRGLTTAAGLWCSAAIGLGAGFGMFVVSSVATAIVLFALTVLDFVDRLIPTKVSKSIALTTTDTSIEAVDRYRDLLGDAGAKVVNLDYVEDFQQNQARVVLRISMRRERLQEAVSRLREGAPEIVKIEVR